MRRRKDRAHRAELSRSAGIGTWRSGLRWLPGFVGPFPPPLEMSAGLSIVGGYFSVFAETCQEYSCVLRCVMPSRLVHWTRSLTVG